MSLLFTLLIAVGGVMAYFYTAQAGKAVELAEKLSPQRAQQLKSLIENRKWVLIGAIVSGVLFLGILLWGCTKRKSISVASGLIEVTGKFVSSHPSLFVVMLLCFFFQLGTLGACFYGLLMIHTSGTPKTAQETEGAPFVHFNYDLQKWGMMIFFTIGTVWCVSFWNNLCDFTVASKAVDHYFSVESGTIGTMCSSLFRHFGSIAYGSLVLLPCAIFNLCFGWVHAIISDDKENGCQRFLRKICCLCMIPYEKCCMRIDDNAFAMVYITKLNFCPAGRKEFYLRRRVEEKVGNATFIGLLYSLLGRIGIASFTAWLSYLVFTKVEYFHTHIKNVLVPVFVSFYL